MNRALCLVGGVLLAPACDRGDGDVTPVPEHREIELVAPLVFELADGQVLRLHEAELADGRVGLVELHGDAVDVTRGRIGITRVSDAGHLVVEQADSTLRTAATERNEHEEHEVFDADLDAIELRGFERAVFHGPTGPQMLHEPIVIDAVGLAWTGSELRVLAGDTDRSSRTGEGSNAGPRRGWFGPRRPRVAVAPSSETVHADSGNPARDGELVDDDEPVVAPGDFCSSSNACDMGTVCVADTVNSDGAFRCLAECVPPAPQVTEDPLPAADSAVCVDDEGCCDPSRECSNGECVLMSSTDGGGSGPSNDVDPDAAGGCDPDGDGVISACDANPNESCKADNDGDGCANSFDENDQDSCQCNARIPKPNSLAVLMVALAFLRGRRRRRAR